MPSFRGAGGAVFEIDNPDAAQVASGALVPVDDAPAPEAPRKAPAKKAAAKTEHES